MNVDNIVKEILELKVGKKDEYYDNLYNKVQNILNGEYSEKDKQKIKNTGRIGTLYMLSSYSDIKNIQK